MTRDPSAPPLGWALIGCGSAGRAHAGWADADPDLAVRGFCDARLDAARALSEARAGTYATVDPARVFADPRVDVVSIATSHDAHADLAVAAMEAGKHLFLEKPMALTTADCLRVDAVRRATGRRLMLNFSIRFSQAARAIRQRLGPVRVSHGQCMQAPCDLTAWRWDPVLGGGPLYDVGVHALDLLCWLHRADPVEVWATGGQVTHPGALGRADMVDTAAATLRFADGSVSTFLMTDAGRSDLVSKWFFEFFDGARSAVLHEHFKAVTFTAPDASGRPQTETLRPGEAPRLCELVAAIRAGTDPAIGAREGILSTLLVECIVESIRSGRPQAVAMPG